MVKALLVKALLGFGSAAVVAAMTATAILVPVEHIAPYKTWVIVALLLMLVALLIQTILQIRDDRQDKKERRQMNALIEQMNSRIFSNASPAVLEARLEPQSMISADDPRLYPEFLDERGSGHLYKKTAIILQNRGRTDAHDVNIETIPLRANRVSFPTCIGVIAPQDKATFEPRMEGRWGRFSQNFVNALMEEWNTYKDPNLKQLEFSLKIVYRNFAGTAMFETVCPLILDPYVEALPRTYGAPHHGRPAIRFGAPKFRKVALLSPASAPRPRD
jgi:hypothetical protein